jgi:hypothetical protein
MNDHHTVKGLSAIADTDNDHITITPTKGDTLYIDQVLFIVWGIPSDQKCD